MQWKLFRFFSLQSFLTIQRGGKIFFIIIIIIIKIDPMIRGQSFGILSIRITETGMLTARNVLFTDSIGLESGHCSLIAKDYERDNRDSDHLVMAFLLSNVGY